MAKIYASRSPEISEREIRNMERSRKIATQGMVLLENNGILPLKNVKTIAAYGNGVRRTVKGGTGSGDVNSRMVINIQQGLEDAGFDTMCNDARAAFNAYVAKRIQEEGMSAIMDIFQNPYKDPDLPMIEEPAKADACVFVIARNSGEGADRHPVAGDYELTDGEKDMITKLSEVYDNIVVVLNVGGVIDTKFLRACPRIGAILNMSQAGNISGYALADVLTGKVTPSGHLTTTWAENYMDYASAPTFSHMNGDVDDEYYNDDIYVGYRYFDTFNIAPAYPFGYGISYTTFDVKADGVCLDGDQVVVKATAVDAVCHGADLNICGVHMLDEGIRKNALVAMMTARGELIALGRMAMSAEKVMASSQGKAVDIERVFMEEGHYPRMWKYSTDLEEFQEPVFPERSSDSEVETRRSRHLRTPMPRRAGHCPSKKYSIAMNAMSSERSFSLHGRFVNQPA